MMDLGYILRRAWQITWRHKTLWLFGFLLSLGAMGWRLGIGGSRWEQPSRWLPPEMQRTIANFADGPYFTVTIVALALLGLAAGVGLALLNALGHAALVDQVRAAEERGGVSLRAGWQAGRHTLWPVFFVRLLLGLPVAAVALAGALPIVVTALLIAREGRPEVVIPGVLAIETFLLTCLTPAVCLAALLAIPLGVLQRLAVRACVLEGRGVRASIARAWTMLRERPGVLALVWLILLGIGVGVLIVLGLPLALGALALLTIATLAVFISPLLYLALTLLVGLIAWLLGAAVSGVAETFFSAVWTLAYRDLTGAGLTGEEALTGG